MALLIIQEGNIELPFENCITYLPIFQLDNTGSEILDDRQRTYEKQF